MPCVGWPLVDVVWTVKDDFVFSTQPSDWIYTAEQRSEPSAGPPVPTAECQRPVLLRDSTFLLTRFRSQDEPFQGMWLERPLMFSELRKEDFNVNYTCRVYSARGMPVAYFTLMPTGKAPITAETFIPNLSAIPALNRLKQSAGNLGDTRRLNRSQLVSFSYPQTPTSPCLSELCWAACPSSSSSLSASTTSLRWRLCCGSGAPFRSFI